MKKICLIIAIVMALAVALPLAVSAHPDMTGDVGLINLPKATPNINGVIEASDGWSAGKYVDKNVYGTFWASRPQFNWTCTIYYAFDDTGLYYAADINDDTFNYSTGKDIRDGGSYGYNGDIFVFMIDPLKEFITTGFIEIDDYTPWYCVGIFAGNQLKMTRTKFDTADITSQVKLAGSSTSTGWRFEAYIPWSIIATDANSVAPGELTFNAADLYAAGAVHNACVMYQDRVFDEDAGILTTYYRYITVKNVLADGTRGYLSSGDCLKAYGIELKLAGETAPVFSGVNSGTPPVTNPSGVTSAGTPIGSSGGASSGNSSGSNGAAATFDGGIITALMAFAASGTGLIFVSKKRKK